MSTLSDLCQSHPVGKLWNAIRYRRISYRFLGFIAVAFLTLYTFYPSNVHRPSLPFSERPAAFPVSPEVWAERAVQVRHAFLHAYHGYERHAAPHDELRPVSNRFSDSFNGWGVTMFDSLDTIILMGLDDEFRRALPLVERTDFSIPSTKFAPFFETVIRYLGGLLSAYALSHEPVLLQKADELGQRLSPAFNTPAGFPKYGVNTHHGKTVGPDVGILAEIASCQMEYTYLAKLTGKKDHFDKANDIIQALARADLSHVGGMFPTKWNISSGEALDDHLSVGSQADSAHEYLLKQYLLTAKTDNISLEMYLRTTTHILTNLLYLSPTRNLLYATSTSSSLIQPVSPTPPPTMPWHEFEHLSCFLPGLLALGVHTLPLTNLASLGLDMSLVSSSNSASDWRKLSSHSLKNLHLWAAEGLLETCYVTYADQPSGLSPEQIFFDSGNRGVLWIDAMQKWKKSGARGVPPGMGEKKSIIFSEEERLKGPQKSRTRDYLIKHNGYLLRPETIESMYILWRVTGNPKWRERGWSIFQSIERETKTPTGYSSLKSVEQSPAVKDDDMPSYFLAETLKYLYLLFTDEDLVPLDKWVFNTEAHPFPVFNFSAQERTVLGI